MSLESGLSNEFNAGQGRGQLRTNDDTERNNSLIRAGVRVGWGVGVPVGMVSKGCIVGLGLQNGWFQPCLHDSRM